MKKIFYTVGLFLLFLTCSKAHAVGPSGCTLLATFNTTSAGIQQVIAAPAAGTPQNIYICSVVIGIGQPATASNFTLVSGTGTNCGTGTTAISALFHGYPSVYQTYNQPSNQVIHIPAGNAVCINMSAVTTFADVQVYYATQ